MYILRVTFEHCSTCPLQNFSNLPHLQTRNINFCYNKEGIITEDIPIQQHKNALVYNMS
jgi:hypothetical protein